MLLNDVFIYVLAPHLESEDENISYYYDFSQSIAEYTKIFAELEVEWKWQPVTMQSFNSIIDDIVLSKNTSPKTPVILNLCDGDEINGTPGVSVVKKLEEVDLIYTGSEEYFYTITTSKIPMKQAFDEALVPTAKWDKILTKEDNIDHLFDKLGSW